MNLEHYLEHHWGFEKTKPS